MKNSKGRIIAYGTDKKETLLVKFNSLKDRELFLKETRKQWKKGSKAEYSLIEAYGLPCVLFSSSVLYRTITSNVEPEYSFFEASTYIINDVHCIMFYSCTPKSSKKIERGMRVFDFNLVKGMNGLVA